MYGYERERDRKGGNIQVRELMQIILFLFETIHRFIATKNLELQDNQNIILTCEVQIYDI